MFRIDIKFHCDEKSNFKNGLLVHGFSYRDYEIPLHNHDFYEMNIVLSGTGVHTIENNVLSVTVGDVFVIPPMVAHAYKNTGGLEVYHVLFHKNFIEKMAQKSKNVNGYLELMEIEPFLRSNLSNPIFLHLNDVRMIELKYELEFIEDKGKYSWEEYGELKYQTAKKLLFWLSALLYEQIKNTKKEKNKNELQILSALEYIHKNYGEKITIDHLCEKACMSRSTFIRSFVCVCGVSPIEYLNNYRLKKAEELLKRGILTKTEVAHECGFYDLSHMKRTISKQN